MKKIIFSFIIFFSINFIAFGQTNNVTSNKVKYKTNVTQNNEKFKTNIALNKDKYKIEILSRTNFYVNEVPKFLIKVYQDEYPIRDLIIKLKVTTPANRLLEFKLNDNGAFGDLKSNDAIFSSFLTGLTGPGLFNIDIHITGNDVDGNPINIEKNTTIKKENYRNFPIAVEPKIIEFRNGVPGVRNSSGFQIQSKSKKRIRVLLYFTSLNSKGRDKIYNWQIKPDPFSLALRENEKKRVDIYITPNKYINEGNYSGYIILDMINTAMKVPLKFEVLKNVNLTFWKRMNKSTSPILIIIYIILIAVILYIGFIIFKKISIKKSIPTKLIIESEDTKTEILLEKDEYTIGRDRDNDIELFDTSVSRKHATINKENGYYKIKDNNSTNGIFVNGKNVSEKTIYKGDSILIGKFKIKVK